MKVGEIMQCSPVTLQIDQTFGEAFHLLTTSRVPMVPVVDANGIYHRTFHLSDIWAILLPRVVKLSRTSLEDLSYVSGSFEKMKDQLTASATLPIRQFLPMKYAPTTSGEFRDAS